MEGSLTSVNNSLSSQYVCLALQHFHRSLSQTLILEKRMFVWFHSTFTGHEVKHSSLQEEKSNAFEMVPFIETKNGPHLLYWGCNKTCHEVKVFSANLSLFFIHTVTETFPQVIITFVQVWQLPMGDDLTLWEAAVSGNRPTCKRSSFKVAYIIIDLTLVAYIAVHWRTFLLHILLFPAGFVPWTRMEWVCRSWRLGEMLLATSLPAGAE